MSKGGKADKRFSILAICERFGWTYQEYLERPLWFDAFLEMKDKADAKAQEVNNKN